LIGVVDEHNVVTVCRPILSLRHCKVR